MFFHDQFFPLYKLWRKKVKKVLAIIKVSELAATKIGSNDEVIYDFIISVFGIDNVIRAAANNTYSLPSLIVPPEGRSLYSTYNYNKLCLEIKNKCIANLNLTPASSLSKIILYTREGLERKNLLSVDSSFINTHCIDKHYKPVLPGQPIINDKTEPIDTTLVHLPSLQMISYKSVPFPQAISENIYNTIQQ